MPFSFYPKHEHNCANVSHCPHLGGAALGTLVLLANGGEQSRRALHARIDAHKHATSGLRRKTSGCRANWIRSNWN